MLGFNVKYTSMENEKQNSLKTKNRLYLLAEFIILFVIAPGLLYFRISLPVLPVLWIFATFCLIILMRDPEFDRANLWRASGLASGGKTMLIQFGASAFALFVLVYFLAPELLFSLMKQRPLLWLIVMFAYPLLSVYPQELVYRTFFFHRYRILFPEKWLFIIVNALLFGYMHIIFHNWVAVGLTIIGGMLFAMSYQSTRSTLLVFVEHSLYGCFLFTVGLGQFFYSGTMAAASPGLKM